MDEVKDRICNALIVLAMLALVGAGFREYLIHNGRLTSDMNADGHSITNLPGGFFPVESVNGMTGAVTVPPTDLAPAISHADEALASFASTGRVANAEMASSATSAEFASSAMFANWSARLSLGGVGDAHFTYEDILAGFLAASNRVDAVAAEFEEGSRTAFNSVHSYSAYTANVMLDDDGNVHYYSDIMEGSTNAANAVAAPLRQDISDLRTESSLVYRLYQGSNVVAEVTNYNSQANAPELKIMQLNESNEYVTVWAETNGLARTLARAKEYADGAIADRAAPRAWSGVTAGMGVEAPSNTTWLSTGRTVIAGGLEYEKHLTSGGAIWLLESNGMAADFHPQTNNTAFIDLSNADGTPIFRVEKTDSFLVGVHVDRVTVDGDALVCGVGVVAAEHPLVRVRASLTSGDWAKEEDGIPASLATVTWSGTAGNWTCRIQNNTGGSQLFAQMEYFQEGGTKIVNSAALDVSAGILCTDGIHKVRPVYNNGNITWEVVQ